MSENKFDLLSTVQYGGCSAKIPQEKLTELLNSLPLIKNENILVDIEHHDDAGVYKINENCALIATTDFFPPICSDAFEFGQIAAANALSDVYAMGGKALLALNLVMFPSSTIDMSVLSEILQGGQNKINEAGAFVMGGHTIEDNPVKYGLAVVGIVDPARVITNSGSKIGQVLILTKPLGTGVLVAAKREGICSENSYRAAIESMKTLNDIGAEVMQKCGVTGATDVTGFGLLGHLVKMAQGANVSFEIHTSELPILNDVEQLLEDGCVPGAAFRNLKNVEQFVNFSTSVSVEKKMVCVDAQTSGGLLMSVDADKVDLAIKMLQTKYPCSNVIGKVTLRNQNLITIL